MGQLLKLIEIRRSSGILLIARRGTLPSVMLKASDDQRRDSTIRTLAQDKPAIMQLRAQWQNVFPARPPETFTPIDLVRSVQRELSAKSIEAVLLRTPKMPLSPADLASITTGAVNVGTNQRRLLIARKGGLPPEVLPYFSPAEAVGVLGQLRDSDETARQLDRQAGRLYPDGKAKLQGANLRRFLAQQITQGTLDAAVIGQAAAAARVASRPDAETPVGKMGSLDRIGEALKRSTPYAVKAGGTAIKGAVEAFLQPESIAIMIAIAAGVALANTNPLTGAAVNTTLVLLGWANGGLKAVQGIGAFVLATIQAQNSKTDAELEVAAKAYGEALGAMGPDLLMAIVGRFVPRKGGASSGKVSVAKTDRTTTGKAKRPPDGTSRATKSKKPVATFGARSTKTEKGAERPTASVLREIRRAKLRENKTLSKNGYPDAPGWAVKTFKSYPEPKTLPEGTKIYRVIDAESNPNGAFWTTQNPAKMSEAQWRSGAAVRGEWNGDGAYVEYTVPKGGLKVWSGEAAPQMSSDGKNVLSGGGNQLWIAQDKNSATAVSVNDAISTGWGN
ncbi:MAG TPA: hypothetical protein PK823_12780, partial [Novosphingobium sp.]|nr:hypothetical protein [Novosphingobium sp.]